MVERFMVITFWKGYSNKRLNNKKEVVSTSFFYWKIEIKNTFYVFLSIFVSKVKLGDFNDKLDKKEKLWNYMILSRISNSLA